MTVPMRLHPRVAGIGMTSQRVRDRLVDRLRQAGIRDEAVLSAMRLVPRHLFIDEALAWRAYEDTALPIGHGQTLSQPWVVARMSEAVWQWRPRKVLEIGTGSGYQAAILAALGLEVFTIERIGELLRQARKRLRQLALTVRSKHGDGRYGWPEEAPFDAIIVTAAAPTVMEPLIQQLTPQGRLIAPIGPALSQSLVQFLRHPDGVTQQELAPVSFVPLLTGMLD